MLTFATEIPVSQERSTTDLLAVCKTWILGSPYTEFSHVDFDNVNSLEDWSCSKKNESVHFARCETDNLSIGGLRYLKRESTSLEWTTEIVGTKSAESFWVSIRVSCESSAPSIRLPQPKKPYIIRQLLDSLGGGKDGEFDISDTPLELRNDEIEFASALILGRSENRLPVVYVSAQPNNTPLVDPQQLARWLSGMAHVVVEPNRPFSLRLMLEVDRQNVYGGTVGIYWPDGAGKRAHFLGAQYKFPRDIESAVSEEIRVALANRRPLSNCTWAFLRETLSRRAYQRLKAEGSTEISQYVDAFDAEIQAKEERIQEAEKEISRLQAVVRALEAKCSSLPGGSILSFGKEQDFFPGEIRDIVLTALSDATKSVRSNSRRRHVLDDLLRVNKQQGEAQQIEEEIKSLFKAYRDMDARCRSALERLGFEVSEDGKHYKAVFQGDGRYTFTIPKTSSDHRAGKNLASDIKNILL